jgi:5-methylcytosine-specific restriction endonuclease McrA
MQYSTSTISRRVLVLNRLWQPVHICGVRRALSLLYKGSAHVVSADDGSFMTHGFNRWAVMGWHDGDRHLYVRTISLKIRVPEIIILIHYDNLPLKEVKLTRKNVYLRDRNTCQYCGRSLRESELNLDHILPKRLGGPTTWTNIVCSCVECNLRKGEKTLRASGMGLLRSPRKPRWSPFNHMAFTKSTYPSWEHFLNPSGWKVQISSGLS